jgi:hypothetical protein
VLRTRARAPPRHNKGRLMGSTFSWGVGAARGKGGRGSRRFMHLYILPLRPQVSWEVAVPLFVCARNTPCAPP